MKHNLKTLIPELEILEPIIVRHKLDNTKIKILFEKLYEINLNWKIEDDIRDHERNSDFGFYNFIELARSVYFTNDVKRTHSKNKSTLLLAQISLRKNHIQILIKELNFEDYNKFRQHQIFK